MLYFSEELLAKSEFNNVSSTRKFTTFDVNEVCAVLSKIKLKLLAPSIIE